MSKRGRYIGYEGAPQQTLDVQSAHLDASLADGDSLLFHGLVNCHLVRYIHLVKFVNAADAVVSKHQGTSLNGKFIVLRFLQQKVVSVSFICITKGAESPIHFIKGMDMMAEQAPGMSII